MGRQLRFEPARAFRTLLISYCKPTEYVPGDADAGADAEKVAETNAHAAGRLVELSLPSALESNPDHLWFQAGEAPSQSSMRSVIQRGS